MCAGEGALKVFPGNLLLLQCSEDKGSTDDGKDRQLVWCLSCCWWEGTHCAWTFPTFLPSLPAGEDCKHFSSCLWRGLLSQLAACEALRAGLGKR